MNIHCFQQWITQFSHLPFFFGVLASPLLLWKWRAGWSAAVGCRQPELCRWQKWLWQLKLLRCRTEDWAVLQNKTVGDTGFASLLINHFHVPRSSCAILGTCPARAILQPAPASLLASLLIFFLCSSHKRGLRPCCQPGAQAPRDHPTPKLFRVVDGHSPVLQGG